MRNGVNAGTRHARRGSASNWWLSAIYTGVAVCFCFVPSAGIEWFAASERAVLTAGIAVAVALGVLHSARNRWPVAVLTGAMSIAVIEAITVGTTSVGAVLFCCDAIYTVVVSRSARRGERALPMIAAACLSASIAGLLLANVLAPPFLQATILVLAVGVTLWWAVSVRMPMGMARRERERAALIARAADAHHREALTAERLQIAREIHDTISGHLSAIAMQSAAAAPSAGEGDSGATRLALIRGLSLDAIADMRSLIDVLRDSSSTDHPQPSGWENVGRLIADASGAGAEIILSGLPPSDVQLDPPASTAAYSIVRESLSNAAKHSPGAAVGLALASYRDHVQITVDNAMPTSRAAAAPSTGYGLIGLSERARLCGGTVDAGPSNGRWRVVATLPRTAAGRVAHA